MLRTSALTIDDFALLARVAELRNLSAVAREREVPPSQVSRALARIERECGARLVHRSTHGLSLTEEGETVAAHGAQLLAVAGQIDAELDERRAEPSGLVRVATSPVFGLFLLPGLEALLDRHPRLRVEIDADDRLVDIVREGIDIALRTGEPASEGLVARPIGQHLRVVCASPSYLARHGRPAGPAELAQHRLIGSSASPVLNRWRFGSGDAAQEIKVAGTLRTDNTGIALAMALQGLGIARVNRAVATPYLADGRLVSLFDGQVEQPPHPIYAVMLPDRQRLPKVRVCVDHFAAWFAAGMG